MSTRTLAPVRIRGDRLYAAEQVDWIATCRVCADRLTTGDHREALAWAHGHMHVRHPGWGRPKKTQRMRWHPDHHRVHNHGYDPTCREQFVDGRIQGECMARAGS